MHLRKKASVETIFIRKTKNGKMENKSLHVILVKLETSLLRTYVRMYARFFMLLYKAEWDLGRGYVFGKRHRSF